MTYVKVSNDKLQTQKAANFTSFAPFFKDHGEIVAMTSSVAF